VRLCGVQEWSVEYDELNVTVWVSTATADYKLLSPALTYEPLWTPLQRKTALAARAIALLLETPNLPYKTMVRHAVRLNTLPGVVQIQQVP